jgi:uncharacterized protein
MPRAVHFLIVSDDIERASAFYSNVLGWRIRRHELDENYWIIETGEESENHITFGMIERSDPLGSPIVTFDVPSLDEAIKKVKQYGGRIIRPQVPLHGVGYIQYCEDSEGNLFGLIKFQESAL